MLFTKNMQSADIINAIAKRTFSDKSLKNFSEFDFSRSYFSYLLEFDDGFRAVLKKYSGDSEKLMKNDLMLMENENQVLKLIRGKLSVKTPEVYFYDDSCSFCSEKYILMEYISGTDYLTAKSEFSNNEKNEIDVQIGKIVKNTSFVESDYFGSPANPLFRFNNLYDFFHCLLENAILDAEKNKIDLTVSGTEIRNLLEENRKFFDFTETPSLVHFNLSEKNILIKNHQIEGIVNWEKAVFGDPLMEDRFRLEKYTPAFLDGFGQSQFSFKEIKRLLWYDLFLYLSIMIESVLEKNSKSFDTAFSIFKQSLEMLKEQF